VFREDATTSGAGGLAPKRSYLGSWWALAYTEGDIQVMRREDFERFMGVPDRNDAVASRLQEANQGPSLDRITLDQENDGHTPVHRMTPRKLGLKQQVRPLAAMTR
jgi:hypothetical protein